MPKAWRPPAPPCRAPRGRPRSPSAAPPCRAPRGRPRSPSAADKPILIAKRPAPPVAQCSRPHPPARAKAARTGLQSSPAGCGDVLAPSAAAHPPAPCGAAPRGGVRIRGGPPRQIVPAPGGAAGIHAPAEPPRLMRAWRAGGRTIIRILAIISHENARIFVLMLKCE